MSTRARVHEAFATIRKATETDSDVSAILRLAADTLQAVRDDVDDDTARELEDLADRVEDGEDG